MFDFPQAAWIEHHFPREEREEPFLADHWIGRDSILAQAAQPAVITAATSLQGHSVYLDMGLLYSYVLSNCIQWRPEPVQIIQAKVDLFLQTLFASFNNDGINKVELAFAQLSDIDALLAGKGGSPTDTIGQILRDGYRVGTTKMNFLRYFTLRAHQSKIKVQLSFGGLNATAADWTLNGAPAVQAARLQKLMALYKIENVDWDIEGPGISYLMEKNKPADVLTFFNTLHTLLAKEKKLSIITLAGSIQDGPAGPLGILFKNFKANFDAANLLLYSSAQYCIDADHLAWGLNQWLSYVKHPEKMRVGFYDRIPYENPSASAGALYPIPPRLSRGKAAAWLYSYVLGQLGYTVKQFGQPFWWTDQPTRLPTSRTLHDFWKALQ